MCTNIANLVNTPISEVIDPAVVSALISEPPFIQINGLFNLRDIAYGSCPRLRRNYCLRCGSFEQITDRGKAELVEMGVKTVFNLRSTREMDAFPHAAIPGVEVVPTQTETDPLESSRHDNLSEMYLDMLETHRGSFRRVLEHVRDQPEKPFLVHCTAGKDRTGVVVALILGIAGVSAEDIAQEYALTRVGIEPVRSLLLAKMSGRASMDWSDPRIQAVARMDPQVMEEFMQQVSRKYSGTEGYVMQVLEFNDKDVETMRRNLLQQD